MQVLEIELACFESFLVYLYVHVRQSMFTCLLTNRWQYREPVPMG